MALSGNWSQRGRHRERRAPEVKVAFRHGDRIVLAGQPLPERVSRRKAAALRERGYID